ncbi:MAG: PKD domain-containing protein, partial [Flavobacteriales bacterium]
STLYTVVVTDANGCISSNLQTLVSVNNIQNVQLHVTPPQNVCAGTPVSLSANVTNGMGAYTFTWTNGLGPGPGPFVFTPVVNGIYIVTITDECNNTKQDTIPVIVNPLPQVSLQPFNVTACGEASYDFTNNSPVQPGDQYAWDFGDGTGSNLPYPQHSYTTSGTYIITVEVTSAAGCQASATTTGTILVHPQTEAFFDADKHEASEYDATIQFFNTSSYAVSYQWDFAGLGGSNQENPFFQFPQAGTYPVTLITNNQWGCADTVVLNIVIYPEYALYVPNAFTPDGDGTNDFFFTQGYLIEEFEMMIYNRWGEAVFTSTSINQQWDGTHQGQKVQDGVYVYKIKMKDVYGYRKEVIGSLTLLR